ncbi:MAG: hypothetical protein PUI75_05110 [Subdoligranulum sp.]|nr:hypothetical protein [Subdoligranulum sp.]
MPIAKGVGKGYNLFWFCFFRYTLGNTAQFPPCGLSTAPAAAAPRSPYRHLELCGVALTHNQTAHRHKAVTRFLRVG